MCNQGNPFSPKVIKFSQELSLQQRNCVWENGDVGLTLSPECLQKSYMFILIILPFKEIILNYFQIKHDFLAILEDFGQPRKLNDCITDMRG